MEQIKKFFNDESGATLGEYSLLVLVIGLAIIGGIHVMFIIASKLIG